jgi:GDP-L-fucose synthase
VKTDAKIFVAGHTGLVGAALLRRLPACGYDNLVLRSRAELDLRDQAAVRRFFEAERPQCVFLAAARVGGIQDNATHPAAFIYDNLAIQTNVIHEAYASGVDKLLFLGSSCAYPKHAAQPLKEEALLTGPLEPTNEPYAIAKIAGLRMCAAYNRQYGTNFLCAMPTNLYGPGDDFDPEHSHVLPALIRKCHEAKVERRNEIEIWGTGTPRREFLYSDDLADACIHLMARCDAADTGAFVNVGWGRDISIRELAELIAEVTGFGGGITFDHSRPDGTPRKLLDVSRMWSLGWAPVVSLREGLRRTYEHYRSVPTSQR